VCESTYGGEKHDTAEVMAENMAKAIHRAANEGGKILIPAFSLGRTQLIIHYLRKWIRQGVIPNLRIHVDSPLGRKLHKTFLRHPAEFAEPYRDDLEIDWLEGRDDATDVSLSDGSRIIVASGGMLEGGRILHHLRFHIDDPRATLLLVSYQAPGTLGEQMLEKNDSIRFNGRRWNKWINVTQVRGFSGHADHADLLAAITPLAGSVGKIRLVHGETERSEAIAGALKARGFADVAVPEMHETATLS
jgi:metallo-beta-lactamase family protein